MERKGEKGVSLPEGGNSINSPDMPQTFAPRSMLTSLFRRSSPRGLMFIAHAVKCWESIGKSWTEWHILSPGRNVEPTPLARLR